MKNILTLLLSLFAGFSLSAQWTTDTEVNTLAASQETGDMQSLGTSDGKTYIAFWHDVPAPQYYEMRLQLLDENGIAQFGPDGMLVNNVVPMSSFTTTWSMAIDHANNVYIGFNGSGAGNSVYVHKISPAGVQLWGSSGIVLGSGFDTKILPMSNGEVVVSWLPGNKGSVLKLDQFGVAVWPSPITIEPLVASHKTSAGEMAELSGGDFVVILHDRNGPSPSSLPYAQRYNGIGTPVWATPVALSNNYYTAFNRRYPLTQDGDNLYFGYSGAQGIQPFAFLQRINPDGTLPWGINGARFSTQTTDFERDIKIAYETGSDVVWAICEYSNSSQGEVGEYVQKFDKLTGARLLSDAAKVVYPIGPAYRSHRGSLQLVEGRPLFVISDGDSNGVFPKDILAVYLDEYGDFIWPEKTHPVATNATGVKSRIQFNVPANKQATCVWTESRAGAESKPFAQNISVACNSPIAGFNFVAVELDVHFVNTSTDGINIWWDFGDGNSSTVANPAYTYAVSGTYTVCQYVVNLCGVDTVCHEVTVVGCMPPTAGFYFIPNSLTVDFTSTALNATDMAWDFGDGILGFGTTVSHTYPQSGNYTVCQLAFNACGVDTFCTTVAVMSSGTTTPQEAFFVAIMPNPSSGIFSVDLNFPEPASVLIQLYSPTGQLLNEQSVNTVAGRQQIRMQDIPLPPGVNFVRVSANGAIRLIPLLVGH